MSENFHTYRLQTKFPPVEVQQPDNVYAVQPELYRQWVENGWIDNQTLPQNHGVDCIHVIVTNYNNKQWIEELINSFLSCQPTNCRLNFIYTDDESTDGTLEYLRDNLHRLNSERTSVALLGGSHQGVSLSRNVGIHRAIIDAIKLFGEQAREVGDKQFLNRQWVCFIDGDDFVSENYFSEFERIVSEKPNCLMAMSRIPNYIQDAESVQQTNDDIAHTRALDDQEFFLVNFETYRRVVARCLFRLDIIANSGLIFPTTVHYGEDLVFNWLYSLTGMMVNPQATVFTIPDSYYYYRKDHQSSLSVRFEREQYEYTPEKVKESEFILKYMENFCQWVGEHLRAKVVPSYLRMQFGFMVKVFTSRFFLPVTADSEVKYLGLESKYQFKGFVLSDKIQYYFNQVIMMSNEIQASYRLYGRYDCLMSYRVLALASSIDYMMKRDWMHTDSLGWTLPWRQYYLTTDIRHHLVDPLDLDLKSVYAKGRTRGYSLNFNSANIEAIRLMAKGIDRFQVGRVNEYGEWMSLLEHMQQHVHPVGEIQVDDDLINQELKTVDPEEYQQVQRWVELTRTEPRFGNLLWYDADKRKQALAHMEKNWSRAVVTQLEPRLDELVFGEETPWQQARAEIHKQNGIDKFQFEIAGLKMADYMGYEADPKQTQRQFTKYAYEMQLIERALDTDILIALELLNSPNTAYAAIKSHHQVIEANSKLILVAIEGITDPRTLEIAQGYILDVQARNARLQAESAEARTTNKPGSKYMDDHINHAVEIAGFDAQADDPSRELAPVELIYVSSTDLENYHQTLERYQAEKVFQVPRVMHQNQDPRSMAMNLALLRLRTPEYLYLPLVLRSNSDIVLDFMQFRKSLRGIALKSLNHGVIQVEQINYYFEEHNKNLYFASNSHHSDVILFNKEMFSFGGDQGLQYNRGQLDHIPEAEIFPEFLTVANFHLQNPKHRGKIYKTDIYQLEAAKRYFKQQGFSDIWIQFSFNRLTNPEYMIPALTKDLVPMSLEELTRIMEQSQS